MGPAGKALYATRVNRPRPHSSLLPHSPLLRKSPATYEDLCALPEHMVGEIVDGELFASPRPAPRHAFATSALGGGLNTLFGGGFGGAGGPGGWVILDEPELHLGAHVLVPDVGGWRSERMPVLPESAWFDVAPDWICEVVSPSTAGFDRVVKMPRYAEHGFGHAWLVDPISRTLEVFRLVEGQWTMVGAHQGGERVRAEPFDAVELDLSLLWPAEDT